MSKLLQSVNTATLYDQHELLKRIAAGDEIAFGELFHAWRDKLYFFMLRITSSPETAEDVMQETFVKVWVNRDRLASIDNFDAYIYRMTENKIIDGMRRMALETSILAELKQPSTVPAADEGFLHKQLNENLKRIVEHLPQQQKMVYFLVREQGLRHDEVAWRLNISSSTVKNHMTQALHTIRERLIEHYPTIAFYLLFLLEGTLIAIVNLKRVLLQETSFLL